MKSYCDKIVIKEKDKSWKLSDWFVDFFIKDSSIYDKVDFVIDPDQRVVDRFKNFGRGGNVLKVIN